MRRKLDPWLPGSVQWNPAQQAGTVSALHQLRRSRTPIVGAALGLNPGR
jgi:hypothetical protein